MNSESVDDAEFEAFTKRLVQMLDAKLELPIERNEYSSLSIGGVKARHSTRAPVHECTATRKHVGWAHRECPTYGDRHHKAK